MTVIRKDGTARIKLISPGVGSSGYYSPALLEKSATKFVNIQCHWDHPTAKEEAERPEGSLRNLAGKLVGTPVWDANGPTGPGIYADMQVFKPYREHLEELAPHIGMSIRATGKAVRGEIEGRMMPVIESIDSVRSVDAVTLPGRGGEILQLFESAAHGGRAGDNQHHEEAQVNEQEVQALREANAGLEGKITELTVELARLKEAAVLGEARTFVAEALAKRDMPEITRTRLVGTLAKAPVLKDGALDKDAFGRVIEEAAKVELAYLATVSGSGKVTGMGGTAGASDDGHKALTESFVNLYRAQGKTPEEAAKLAESAAAGR